MEVDNSDQDFNWIGEGISKHKRKVELHYEAFSIGDLTVHVGDYVLVRNDDCADPEDVQNCYVALVTDLYDRGGEVEPFQAKVQWYFRIAELPKHFLKTLDNVDYEHEVVEEKGTAWSKIIDAETIFQKCLVTFAPVDSDFQSLLQSYEYNNDIPVFYCRYGFNGVRTSHKVGGNDKKLLKRSTSFSSITPKKEVSIPKFQTERKGSSNRVNNRSIEQARYTAIPDSKSLRVTIKKLDDRILESQDGSVKVIVADSSYSSIEEIAEKIKMKLNFENITVSPRKRPTIHSLVPVNNQATSNTNHMVDDYNDFETTPKKTKKASNKVISLKGKTPTKSRKDKNVVKTPVKKQTPSKAHQNHSTPVRTITRYGRKVKPSCYSYIDSSDEEARIANFRVKKQSPSKIPRRPRFYNSDVSDSGSNFSASEGSDSESADDGLENAPKLLNKKLYITTPKSSKKASLSIPERNTPFIAPQNILEESRQRLHVSTVPKSLPCREEEYSDIYSFVKGCLNNETGGCMYVSGVPGTGKTATVHEVMRNLESEKESGEVSDFTFVEVNGMWMTDPYQCYVHIYKKLAGKSIASQQAAELLEKRFTGNTLDKEAVVLLVDELDRLWTRKQTVMYNIFDWPSRPHSKLIVLAIANTMDLPERLMMNRISSRLGLTRKTFQPYTFRQLQEIVMSRIQELNAFDPDAVQLVARKVAAVSGDARRALDICRFAAEVAERTSKKGSPRKAKKVLVGMEHVDVALQQIFSSPVILAIRSSSGLEKLFLKCILAEFSRVGTEEAMYSKVYHQLVAHCRFEGLRVPNVCEVSEICSNLASSHLILVDNFQYGLHMKIRLNISADDVSYAVNEK